MKNLLLYLALFFLIILLFIPPVFRLTMKDMYKREEKPKDVYGMLYCEKNDENINESYLNYKPYGLKYNYKSDKEILINDGENNETGQISENSIVNDIYDYSNINFNSESNWYEYTVDLNNISEIPEKLVNYTRPIDEQMYYYGAIGFTCNKTEY